MPIPGSRFQKFVPGIVKFFIIVYIPLYIFHKKLYILHKKLYIFHKKKQKNKKIKKIKKESGPLLRSAGGRAPLTKNNAPVHRTF